MICKAPFTALSLLSKSTNNNMIYNDRFGFAEWGVIGDFAEHRNHSATKKNEKNTNIKQKNVRIITKNADIEPKNVHIERKNTNIEPKNVNIERNNEHIERKNVDIESNNVGNFAQKSII